MIAFMVFDRNVQLINQWLKTVIKKIKLHARRDMNPVPIKDTVKNLNATVRGWSNYFYYGYGHRKIKWARYDVV